MKTCLLMILFLLTPCLASAAVNADQSYTWYDLMLLKKQGNEDYLLIPSTAHWNQPDADIDNPKYLYMQRYWLCAEKDKYGICLSVKLAPTVKAKVDAPTELIAGEIYTWEQSLALRKIKSEEIIPCPCIWNNPRKKGTIKQDDRLWDCVVKDDNGQCIGISFKPYVKRSVKKKQ